MKKQAVNTKMKSAGVATAVDPVEAKIQENITNWQSGNKPLAPLCEEQLDVIYQIEDVLRETYYAKSPNSEQVDFLPLIDSNREFLKWFLSCENEVKNEHLYGYQAYFDKLNQQCSNVENLLDLARHSTDSLKLLQETHKDVLKQTNYLHDLSEDLMKQQRVLKTKKEQLFKQLQYFIPSNAQPFDKDLTSDEFTKLLDSIVDSIENLSKHMNYKEARVYRMKKESQLISLLNDVYKYVNNVITEVSKQVVDPESKPLGLIDSSHSTDVLLDSAFSLYYGKFQSASNKVSLIISYLEEKEQENEHFQNTLADCQRTYLTLRLPLLNAAVTKSLGEIRDKHKMDHSVLFRSSSLFTMKVCQDEATCFHYFFKKPSEQLEGYLGTLCQNLYDMLRPCLIMINHIEVLTELCNILRREILNEKVLGNEYLTKYVETMQQLLQDVEERLVFRTNIFFQHDLLGYTPSSGDLAYPEKLIQMENIALELQEHRANSRASVVSMESEEVRNINSGPAQPLRSYTGNSAADLHGMWYPTVKRTLVCLSRLYFCLDRETFQALAQEALVICIRTVHTAAALIAEKKGHVDSGLFEIKHLLIIREQIAPFQVDFTVKEMALDFSNIQKAAATLLSKRDKLFTFGSNNALLEFLLEGTPKVREYLIDSRKEIDKQLKISCETFISNCSGVLVGNLLQFLQTVERFQKTVDALEKSYVLREQEFAKPEAVATVVAEAQKNMKVKIPEIQRSMQLYLANRETEFILFRPIKNNVINAFIQLEQLLQAKYTNEDQLLVACPSAVQISVLVSSVSLAGETEQKHPPESAQQAKTEVVFVQGDSNVEKNEQDAE